MPRYQRMTSQTCSLWVGSGGRRVWRLGGTLRFVLGLGAAAWVAGYLPMRAQTNPTSEVTQGFTPAAIAPGSPAGSYALSGFDTVNLFNGKVNVRLPLLDIGGRGEAG